MPGLPLSPRKLYSLLGEVREQSHASAPVLVAGSDADAVESVRAALAEGAEPEAAARLLVTETVPDGDISALPSHRLETAAALVLVVAPGELEDDAFGERLERLAAAAPSMVLVLTRAPGMALSFPAAGVGPRQVVGMAPDGRVPADVLGEAIAEAAGDESLALAAWLPAIRDVVCERLIRNTARQNGIIGLLFFVPGADMPVMTLNQARMLLKLAAAHGEPVGLERAVELIGVAGSGLGLRALARQLLCVVPGPGWLLKGGVGYGGTMAMGRAVKTYFSGDARVTPSRLAALVEKAKRLRGRARQVAPGTR